MSTEQLASLHASLCPFACDGSRRGTAVYLARVVSDSGRSLEVVSYAWRTQRTWGEFRLAVYG